MKICVDKLPESCSKCLFSEGAYGDKAQCWFRNRRTRAVSCYSGNATTRRAHDCPLCESEKEAT